ncbi:PQ loop repeat protein [Histoplasma capsulatum var. duboisii H88]|uniref:PQ loop repeat protein n=1 Tax=Ajellomyces capsulatus (strain H88) TaxID=544711 RepID=A0A8A1LPV3_AJEC8|nr:PQ loop repeat protein [Histoplasma capsulatum var. duboisii H88]
MDVPVAANVLGTIGAVCWCIQLLPQIAVNHRRHHTEGLQPSMMILWAIAGVPLGTYNIVEEFNIALRIQPQILTLLSLATWTQCMYYGKVYTLILSFWSYISPTPSLHCSRARIAKHTHTHICISEMAREEMSHYCFYSLRRVRRCPSRPNIFAPNRKASRSPMAHHHDGHFKRLSPRCWCA